MLDSAQNRKERLCANGRRLLLVAMLMALVPACPALQAQITVRPFPPAAMLDPSGSLPLRALIEGTLPGQPDSPVWSLNGQPFARSAFTLEDASPDGPTILRPASAADPSRFGAVMVVSLQKSEISQITLPNAVAYHPVTGRIYAAVLIDRGPIENPDSAIVEIAPGGNITTVATLQSEVLEKLIPYRSSNGTAYLLAVGSFSGTVQALNLSTRTFRRVVSGLVAPLSGGIHPVSGDLYIAENAGNNAGRVSVVSRTALDSAVAGGSTASFSSLPLVFPGPSGIGFRADGESRRVSLLVTTFAGALFQVDLESVTFRLLAAGLALSQELLVIENSAQDFPYVLTSRSEVNSIDELGQITALANLDPDITLVPAYPVATRLDVPTDLAFLPEGNSYSPSGRAAIIASNSSRTASRGKVLLWETGADTPGNLFHYYDRVQPSLQLLAPAAGDILAPGAPVELRWRKTETNPMNPARAHFPGPVQILLSTDGGDSFPLASIPYVPSGPRVDDADEYRLSWPVPLSVAGQSLRLRVESQELDGSTIADTSSGDIQVLPRPGAIPMPLFAEPNFVVAGQTAEVTVDGLNLTTVASIEAGEGVTIEESATLSASRLQLSLSADALAAEGARTLRLCDTAMLCREKEAGLFVLVENAPRITGIEPRGGPPGTAVIIAGENFSTVAENNVVTFGSFRTPVAFAEPDRLGVLAPFGLNRGSLPVRVRTNDVASNTAAFTLSPAGLDSPLANRDGMVNAASFAPGDGPVSPGSIVSLFGIGLAAALANAASPLPFELLDTAVFIGGMPAPLFFVSPNQINAQVPEETGGMESVAVTVVSRGAGGNTIALDIAPRSPGIFSADSSGQGPGAVLNQDNTLNGPDNPEKIGNTVQVFATGLGVSAPAVLTGAAAPSDPLARAVSPPTATVDGTPATVTFAGRAPGFVGLDQVNVVIPEGVSTEDAVPLTLHAGPRSGNTVTIHVQP